jgi:hypothetical protein
LHGGHSLIIGDGKHSLLVKCWHGCDSLEVLIELRRMGLNNPSPRIVYEDRRENGDDDDRRRNYALSIWRASWRGEGSPVETYLASRGITLDPWPATLRFHPRCPRTGEPLPAMLGLVEHVERGPIGIHRSYLKADGSAKAEVDSPAHCQHGRRCPRLELRT